MRGAFVTEMGIGTGNRKMGTGTRTGKLTVGTRDGDWFNFTLSPLVLDRPQLAIKPFLASNLTKRFFGSYNSEFFKLCELICKQIKIQHILLVDIIIDFIY